MNPYSKYNIFFIKTKELCKFERENLQRPNCATRRFCHSDPMIPTRRDKQPAPFIRDKPQGTGSFSKPSF